MDKRSSLIASDRLLFFFVYVSKYPAIKQTKLALRKIYFSPENKKLGEETKLLLDIDF